MLGISLTKPLAAALAVSLAANGALYLAMTHQLGRANSLESEVAQQRAATDAAVARAEGIAAARDADMATLRAQCDSAAQRAAQGLDRANAQCAAQIAACREGDDEAIDRNGDAVECLAGVRSWGVANRISRATADPVSGAGAPPGSGPGATD